MKHIAEHPEVGPAGQASSVPGKEEGEKREERGRGEGWRVQKREGSYGRAKSSM